MATYAKILKDPEGNQILPYTRSKLVYMDDGSTVEDAVTRPATNAQMGRVLIGNNLGYDGNGTISLSKFGVCNALGYTPVKPDDYADNNKYGVVKVGSNILEEDGVISIDDRCIKEALGYTPTDDNTLYYTNTTVTISSYINSGYFLGGGLRIFRQGAVCYFFIDITTASDWIANTSIPFAELDRRFMPNPLSCTSAYDQKNYITRTGPLYFTMHWYKDSQKGEFYVRSNNYTSGTKPKMILYAYPNVTIPSGANICGSCTYMTQNYPGDSTNRNTPVKTFSGANPDISG